MKDSINYTILRTGTKIKRALTVYQSIYSGSPGETHAHARIYRSPFLQNRLSSDEQIRNFRISKRHNPSPVLGSIQNVEMNMTNMASTCVVEHGCKPMSCTCFRWGASMTSWTCPNTKCTYDKQLQLGQQCPLYGKQAEGFDLSEFGKLLKQKRTFKKSTERRETRDSFEEESILPKMRFWKRQFLSFLPSIYLEMPRLWVRRPINSWGQQPCRKNTRVLPQKRINVTRELRDRVSRVVSLLCSPQ